jgi:uncharacterized protein YegP (UPF0339 family)
MKDEYDFSGGVRGKFHRPEQAKRYVITLDHRPTHARFEIHQDDENRYAYVLKQESGEVLISRGPFSSKREVLSAIDSLRQSIIGAETVESK